MFLLMLVGLIAACEKAIDPRTGERELRVTLPGTAANETAAQRRWRQCVQFRSESFCARNLAGGRPPGSVSQTVADQPPLERDGDP